MCVLLKSIILLTSYRIAGYSTFRYSKRICAARRQPVAQQLKRRWQNEDADRIVDQLTNARRALDVDFQNNVFTRGAFALDLRLAGAVKMSVNIGPFEELTLTNQAFERRGRNEEIFAAILFRSPRRARCVRNRIANPGHRLQNTINQSALAAARWRADYDQHSPSTLCGRGVFAFGFVQLIQHSALVRVVSQPQP